MTAELKNNIEHFENASRKILTTLAEIFPTGASTTFFANMDLQINASECFNWLERNEYVHKSSIHVFISEKGLNAIGIKLDFEPQQYAGIWE